jgi:hypothetical protein
LKELFHIYQATVMGAEKILERGKEKKKPS